MASYAGPGDSFTPAERDAWLPRIRTGYFYIGDRKYYLYAQKRTKTLREATALVFELADVPLPGSVSVLVEGIPFTNFIVEGDELILMLDDDESFAALWMLLELDLTQWDFINHGFAFGPSNEVRVSYRSIQWQDAALFPEPTGNRFTESLVNEVFLIKEAARVDYRLTKRSVLSVPTGIGDTDPLPVPTGWEPDPPQDCAPVVITDDSLEYENPIDYRVEFAIDPLTGEIFWNANRNFLQNPSFEIGSTGIQHTVPTYRQPLEWRVTDPLNTPVIDTTAYHGQLCYGIASTGLIDQVVRINPRQNYTVSVYVKGGTGELCVNFLDLDKVYVDLTGGSLSTPLPSDALCQFSSQTAVGNEWRRLKLHFGKKTGGCDDSNEVFPVPSAAEFMEVRFRRVAGLPCFDAAVVEEGLRATQFFSFDPRITIEWETSQAGFYVKTPRQMLLPEVDYLDLNPLSTPAPGGFLFIEEFSNVDDFQLGTGRIESGLSVVSPTGVVEYTGVADIEVGRELLPYAKTSGWTKLRQRSTFHLLNPGQIHDISDLEVENGTPKPLPADIEFIISEGLQIDTAGNPVLVVVPDSRLPVRVDAYAYDRWENPAFVYRGKASAASGAVDPDDGQTNHAGQLGLTYTPPDVTGVGDLGQIDTITVTVGQVTRTLPVRGFRGTGLDFNKFING